jgi:hypothetical protein
MAKKRGIAKTEIIESVEKELTEHEKCPAGRLGYAHQKLNNHGKIIIVHVNKEGRLVNCDLTLVE